LTEDHGVHLSACKLTTCKLDVEVLLTEQMSFNKGMSIFGKDGATSVIAELRQLDYRGAVEPADAAQMSWLQWRGAL